VSAYNGPATMRAMSNRFQGNPDYVSSYMQSSGPTAAPEESKIPEFKPREPKNPEVKQ